MAVQNVFLVVWRLNEVGGAEQHVTELAIALALSGVRVTLLSQLPLPVSTEFEARLVADGVKVVAPRAVPRLFWGLRAPRIWLRRAWNRRRLTNRNCCASPKSWARWPGCAISAARRTATLGVPA